jgi:hypothetical protein
MDTRKLTRYQHKHARPVHLAIGDNYEKVATMKMGHEEQEKRIAAELVRRWNSHNDLLAALEAILSIPEPHIFPERELEMRDIARAAINKAKTP